MDAAAELGRNPVSISTRFSLSMEMMSSWTGLPNPPRETKFSGAKNANREMVIFPVQLTASRIGNLTRLIHTLAMCVTIHNTTTQWCTTRSIIIKKLFKKNLNSSKPSEHPPRVEEECLKV